MEGHGQKSEAMVRNQKAWRKLRGYSHRCGAQREKRGMVIDEGAWSGLKRPSQKCEGGTIRDGNWVAMIEKAGTVKNGGTQREIWAHGEKWGHR